jgi:hypothetical protein
MVVASDALSFAHPARLGDPDHLALGDTSTVHRDPADGSLPGRPWPTAAAG